MIKDHNSLIMNSEITELWSLVITVTREAVISNQVTNGSGALIYW